MEHRNTDEEAPLTWADLGLPLSYYDLAVVVSFRYFLPTSLLQALPPTINMHPSVLPHYRGASPIFSTLLNNEEVGGVSIIQIKKEDTALMDSGHVLWQCEVPIEPDTDIRTYFPLVTQVGAAGLCDLIFGEGTSNDKKSASSGKVNAIRESTPPTCGCAPPKHGQHKTEKCWRTLCRSPSQLTSVAIERALETHKLCFHHNIKLLSQSEEAEETTVSDRKKRPKPSETQIVTLNCAEVFPDSVLNASSDWPDSFTYSWRFSQSQNYEIILSNPSSCQVKNTVSTYFCNANSKYKSDPYHAPLLPKHVAVLKFSHYTDKDCFGVWRSFVGGEYFSPSVNATLDKTCTPVRNQLVRRVVRQKLRKHLSEQRKQHGGKQKHDKQTVPYDARPKPKMILDESMITRQMILESVEELRLSCSFTQAVHPDVLSPALAEELEAVESGDVYFYRAPPPLFQSILSGAAPHVVKTRILINTKEKSLVLSSRTGRSAGLVAPSITEARDAEALRALLAAEEEDKSASEDEHTPDNYVPEVILIPAEVRCERRKAKPPVRQEPSAEETAQQTSSAGRQFYIPPGTGYFPISDDTVGCIKCSEGWFIWKEAHLKYSSKPQPASLLRKGLAMKNGILYPGLFSEYS
ncbi:Formyl transferase, putative [Angomonas deanei]|uniref:Formyl transferase, putative n=1 Tax=Angomonas deanei TaxID=59799 RepID=A0A7G2C8Q9_9TRYP|nr:Formyl transferase, putative [Angomonas deanei]